MLSRVSNLRTSTARGGKKWGQPDKEAFLQLDLMRAQPTVEARRRLASLMRAEHMRHTLLFMVLTHEVAAATLSEFHGWIDEATAAGSPAEWVARMRICAAMLMQQQAFVERDEAVQQSLLDACISEVAPHLEMEPKFGPEGKKFGLLMDLQFVRASALWWQGKLLSAMAGYARALSYPKPSHPPAFMLRVFLLPVRRRELAATVQERCLILPLGVDIATEVEIVISPAEGAPLPPKHPFSLPKEAISPPPKIAISPPASSDTPPSPPSTPSTLSPSSPSSQLHTVLLEWKVSTGSVSFEAIFIAAPSSHASLDGTRPTSVRSTPARFRSSSFSGGHGSLTPASQPVLDVYRDQYATLSVAEQSWEEAEAQKPWPTDTLCGPIVFSSEAGRVSTHRFDGLASGTLRLRWTRHQGVTPKWGGGSKAAEVQYCVKKYFEPQRANSEAPHPTAVATTTTTLPPPPPPS